MLLKFYRSFLLLSGDISLNHGPCSMQFIDDKTWEAIKTQENFFKFYWTCFFRNSHTKSQPYCNRNILQTSKCKWIFKNISKRFPANWQQNNEIYLLGDFNINLPQNGKFILKENQSYKFKNSSSALVNKYKEFCQTFSLIEIITELTRITCSTSILLDNILTNSAEKVPQKGVTDVGTSDHQLIYCTRKIKRIKDDMHNQIHVQPLKGIVLKCLLLH